MVPQVTDYAIARRIVDLHSRMEKSIERIFSLEEVLRYITFARMFQPKMNKVGWYGYHLCYYYSCYHYFKVLWAYIDLDKV